MSGQEAAPVPQDLSNDPRVLTRKKSLSELGAQVLVLQSSWDLNIHVKPKSLYNFDEALFNPAKYKHTNTEFTAPTPHKIRCYFLLQTESKQVLFTCVVLSTPHRPQAALCERQEFLCSPGAPGCQRRKDSRRPVG